MHYDVTLMFLLILKIAQLAPQMLFLEYEKNKFSPECLVSNDFDVWVCLSVYQLNNLGEVLEEKMRVSRTSKPITTESFEDCHSPFRTWLETCSEQ
jgi:hypothetical protein